MSDLNGKEKGVTLSPADAAAVDAILGGEQGAVDPARRERAQEWLKVLDGAEVPMASADLLERTLGAVAAADRMKLPQPSERVGEPPAHRPRWRRRLAEFGAMGIAAMLFLVVVMSGLSQARKSQIRVACVQNLEKVSNGMGLYAGSSGGHTLPMVAMPSNHNWLRGTADGARNNSSHLMPLVSGGYAPVNAFYCPGAPQSTTTAPASEPAPMSYSYRLMSAPETPVWDGSSSTVVLTDRNPLLANPGKKGVDNANSENHDGRGNNILLASGAVTWVTSPNIGPDHDNIWSITSGKDRVLSYNGSELPASSHDIFVCP